MQVTVQAGFANFGNFFAQLALHGFDLRLLLVRQLDFGHLPKDLSAERLPLSLFAFAFLGVFVSGRNRADQTTNQSQRAEHLECLLHLKP